MDDVRHGAKQHESDQFASLEAENASLRQRVAKLEADALAFNATEEALRRSEERFHRLFAQAHDAMYLVDPTISQVIDVNRHGCTLLDISRDELLSPDGPGTAPNVGQFVGAFIEDIITCASSTMSSGRTMTAGGSPITSAVTLTCRTGQRLQAEASTSLIRLDDRICVLALVRDVSEEKRTAREREEMLADLRRLTAVIDGTSDFVGMTDMTGKMIYVNPAGLRMVGRQGHDLRQLNMGDFLPDSEWTRVKKEIVPVILTSGEVWEGEMHLGHADGHLIPTLQAILVVRDETGDPFAVAAIARDITEMKRSESRAQELSAIVRSADVAIAGISVEGRIRSWNLAAERLFEYSAAEMVGDSMLRLTAPADQANAQRYFDEVCRSGAPISYESELITRAGQTVAAAITISPVADQSGAIIALSSIIHDIRLRKQAEAELVQAKDSVEAAYRVRSEFLANMSHELRTPLNAILGFSQLLSHDNGLTADQRDHVSVIYRSGEKLLALINAILDMTKNDLGRLGVPSIGGDQQPPLAHKEPPAPEVAGQWAGALDPQQLRAQPAHLVAELHQATLEADFDRIIILIDRIGETDDTLSAALATLANDFQYDQIMALTDIAGHDS